MNQTSAPLASILRGSIQVSADPQWRTGLSLSSSLAMRDDARWECARPGLAVTWSARHASHATRDDALCVVWGVPRAGPPDSKAVAPPATAEQVMKRLLAAGPAALAEIKGGFGVFFVDARAKRIILAIDRFSAETVCFGVEGDRLAFSDRADTVPVKTRTLSHQSVFDYLYFHAIPAPATIFREVSRMSHGTYLCVDRGALQHGSHWTPRFEESRRASLPALRDEFRALVGDVVAMEAARSDTLGCFLSGGTDSSTIAGMLCRITGAPARTYSIGFDAVGYDEMAYARIAARHFGTQHREYYVTAEDVISGIPAVAAFVDQPFGNSSVVPAYLCAQMAHADGVTRMLGGDGGDELFGGNKRYSLQQFLELYHLIPAPLREHLIEPPLSGRLGRLGIPGLKQVASYVRNSRIPMPDRAESFNLLARIGASRVLDPVLLASVDETAPLRAQRHTYAEAPASNIVNRMLYYDWKHTLSDIDLPKVRAAVGLADMTVGFPLLADEIADFSLRLPANLKVRHFQLRWFFKKALRGFLPDAIIKKKKHGFGLPFGVWAVRHPALHDLAGDSLAGLERRGILRAGFRDELIGERLAIHPGYYGELLWILMMLEQWLTAHADVATLGVQNPPERRDERRV